MARYIGNISHTAYLGTMQLLVKEGQIQNREIESKRKGERKRDQGRERWRKNEFIGTDER